MASSETHENATVITRYLVRSVICGIVAAAGPAVQPSRAVAVAAPQALAARAPACPARSVPFAAKGIYARDVSFAAGSLRLTVLLAGRAAGQFSFSVGAATRYSGRLIVVRQNASTARLCGSTLALALHGGLLQHVRLVGEGTLSPATSSAEVRVTVDGHTYLLRTLRPGRLIDAQRLAGTILAALQHRRWSDLYRYLPRAQRTSYATTTQYGQIVARLLGRYGTPRRITARGKGRLTVDRLGGATFFAQSLSVVKPAHKNRRQTYYSRLTLVWDAVSHGGWRLWSIAPLSRHML